MSRILDALAIALAIFTYLPSVVFGDINWSPFGFDAPVLEIGVLSSFAFLLLLFARCLVGKQK